MKKIIFIPLIFAAVAVSFNVNAQQRSETVGATATASSDTVHITAKEVQAAEDSPKLLEDLWIYGRKMHRDHKKSSKSSPHWRGIGINYATLIYSGSGSLPDDQRFMSLANNSIGLDFNLVDIKVISGKSLVLFTGLGFEINNFVFANANSIRRDENGKIVEDRSAIDEGIGVRRSKMVTSYLNIPLMIEFRKNKWFVNAGAIGGLRLTGRTKVAGWQDGSRIRIKRRDNLELRDFHLGVAANAGYRKAALTFKYFPQSIFKPVAGLNFEQMNVGLMLTL